MPVYEFKCRECGKLISELRRIGDFSSPVCSQCGSHDTEKLFSLFSGGGSGGKSCQGCSSHGAACKGCH